MALERVGVGQGGARGASPRTLLGDRKRVPAPFGTSLEPVVVARSRVDHDPADRLRHLVRHGRAARLVPRAPRQSLLALGRAAARGVVRFRPRQLEHQPQLEQRSRRLVEPVAEPRVVLVPAPQWGGQRRGSGVGGRRTSTRCPPTRATATKSTGIKLDRLSLPSGRAPTATTTTTRCPIDFGRRATQEPVLGKRVEALRARRCSSRRLGRREAASGWPSADGGRVYRRLAAQGGARPAARPDRRTDLTDEASAHVWSAADGGAEEAPAAPRTARGRDRCALVARGSSNSAAAPTAAPGAVVGGSGGRSSDAPKIARADAAAYEAPAREQRGAIDLTWPRGPSRATRARGGGHRLETPGRLSSTTRAAAAPAAAAASSPRLEARRGRGRAAATHGAAARGAAARRCAQRRASGWAAAAARRTPAPPSAEQPKVAQPAPKALNRRSGSKWRWRRARFESVSPGECSAPVSWRKLVHVDQQARRSSQTPSCPPNGRWPSLRQPIRP